MQAYVYHMYKKHPCGDDFYFQNDIWARTYTSQKTKSIPASYYQPQAGVWYTIWSHVKMNTAGAISSAAKVWLQAPTTHAHVWCVCTSTSSYLRQTSALVRQR